MPTDADRKSRNDALPDKRAISLKLTVTARQMHKRFDQSVAARGITRSQWTLIAVVSRRPGVTQREIAEVLEMSQPAAGRLIDRLCSDGLLLRQPKEDDRRAHCIYLTEAAGALLEEISRIATIHEEDVFAGFTSEELVQLEAFVDKIAANIGSAR